MNINEEPNLRNPNSKTTVYKTTRPHRFLNPVRSLSLSVFLFCGLFAPSQNKIEKQLISQGINTIAIDGNQIFNISVSTSKTNEIYIASKLDGEYQDQFQIVTQQLKDSLKLSLKRLPFTTKVDDKRNAHKVVAATLHLQIPEEISLYIQSDIGSVDLNGNFNSVYIELKQGHCNFNGLANKSTINTIDGYINIITENAKVNAISNHGKVSVDHFLSSASFWTLQSINGNITVAKRE